MSVVRKLKPQHQNPLRLIKGGKSKKAERYVDATWIMAQSALWNNRDFSDAEIRELKQLLEAYYQTKESPKQIFSELIERICLAKRFVARKKGRYISKPQDYLNIHYVNGLSGTEEWLNRVKEQRKTVPAYNEGIAILAKGIIRYMESPSKGVIQKYRKLLIELKQFDLLQIFYNTVINLNILQK